MTTKQYALFPTRSTHSCSKPWNDYVCFYFTGINAIVVI